MNNCQHQRKLEVFCHCSDMSNVRLVNEAEGTMLEHDGYVPSGIGIGGGDDIEITICLDCHRVIGDLADEETIRKVIEEQK